VLRSIMMIKVKLIMNFVLLVVEVCCQKDNIRDLFPKLIFTIEKKRKVHVVYIAWYNIITIGIEMLQLHVKTNKNLFFHLILYIFLFNNSLRSGN
jgi:hypothetical protein